MYPDKYHTGDSGNIALELLDSIPEVEQKCFAVTKAVTEGFFPLDEALNVYAVNRKDYLRYLIKKVMSSEMVIKEQNILLGVFLSFYMEGHIERYACPFDNINIQNHLEAIGQIVTTQKGG